ncbi:MAG: hypothetical protein H8D56_02015 [Planctomycetes bacterium]|nr:hypothetical protein [Planctomycetota bacterium]MBL7146764.1 hypothetical protein [Phycisphaerae bacterium]
MSIENTTLARFRHFSSLFTYLLPCRGNYNIFPDTLFMQNKPNFENAKMNANLFTTKDYEENADFRHGKTKPIQTQFKANLSQNKPNSNPISKAKCLRIWLNY